jgi:L-ascorbate metabolism protein UlaG (beta-lactamase superfamily)
MLPTGERVMNKILTGPCKVLTGILLLMLASAGATRAGEPFETDTITASGGDLTITFIGHGTLMFTWNGLVIHVDPWKRLADYSALPGADIILITHEHGDHLDAGALEILTSDHTEVIVTEACRAAGTAGLVMSNGDTAAVKGIEIVAVPAYNIKHKRKNGEPFHPKGRGNGYIVTFGDTRVYIAGDTENIPEMKELGGIDIAFLPVNLPYTMTPEMAAEAALSFRPRILYPYHFGDTKISKLEELLGGSEDIEVRIRRMK